MAPLHQMKMIGFKLIIVGAVLWVPTGSLHYSIYFRVWYFPQKNVSFNNEPKVDHYFDFILHNVLFHSGRPLKGPERDLDSSSFFFFFFFSGSPAHGVPSGGVQLGRLLPAYATAHSNAGCLPRWTRPGKEPASSWILGGVVSTESQGEWTPLFLGLPAWSSLAWDWTPSHSLASLTAGPPGNALKGS